MTDSLSGRVLPAPCKGWSVNERPLTVVVGGGVAGLAAAYFLGDDGTHDVLVLEAGPSVGGKLRGTEVAGVAVDVGAEAMLHRRPEGTTLARDLGLAVVHPTAAASRVWSRGALRRLPRSLMGVPLDLDQLAASGLLTDAGLARVHGEPSLVHPALADDVSVGDLVASRLGDEVVERLVEPLLGGVYAGRAREISARAAVPQLFAMAQRGSLVEQGATMPASDLPVFAGIEGGMHLMPAALVASGRFTVRTGTTVRDLVRTPEGFAMTVGSTQAPELLEAAAVVLATPAAPTARLLRGLAPVAAAELAGIESASVAVVTLAFRTAQARVSTGSTSDAISGFLVPPVEGRAIKASTFSFAKWDWVRAAGRDAGDVVLLRTSVGRHREEAALQVSDEELVSRSLADLADAGGLAGLADTAGLRGVPLDTHVQRWGGALPQYAVGHVGRVERIRADVSRVPGLAVCGAAYDGVGIPAVIASARHAVAQVRTAQWST